MSVRSVCTTKSNTICRTIVNIKYCKKYILLILVAFFVSFVPRKTIATAESDLLNGLERSLPQMSKTLIQNGNINIHAVNKEGKNALMLAAERGYNEIVFNLNKMGENINKKAHNNHTAIMLAAKNCHTSTVKLLLKLGSDIEEKNGLNEHLLTIAAKNGCEGVVDLLIENDIDLEEVDSEGATALMWASFKGYREVVELLLENGAEIEPKKSQSNAVMWSILGDDKIIFNILSRELWGDSINPNYRNKSGSTMLMFAAIAKNVSMVKYLIHRGCDVNAVNYIGETALMLLAAPRYRWMDKEKLNTNSIAVARVLIREGAKTNIQSEFGETALSYAMILRDRKLIKELLDNRADPNIPDDHLTTPLMDAVFNGETDIAKMLISKGASLVDVDYINRSSLVYAILGGSLKSVELTLSEKSNIEDTEDEFGWTPLILAANMGNVNIVKILLNERADINGTGRQKETALMRASFVRNTEVVKILLDNDVDVEAVDRLGKTALMWAAEGGFGEIIEMLIEKGANPFALDVEQRDPVDIAISQSKTMAASIIEEKQNIILSTLSDEELKKYYNVWKEDRPTNKLSNKTQEKNTIYKNHKTNNPTGIGWKIKSTNYKNSNDDATQTISTEKNYTERYKLITNSKKTMRFMSTPT
ncbi:MAG: ankyrin repeat domain-containing protein [Alphaproteobacteria bacterium]|nr:ankyrin repeat domain-containing protein [Rickettsiales bacterium]